MEWNYNDLINWDDTKGNVPNVIKLNMCWSDLRAMRKG